MAANTRSKAAAWGENERVGHTNFETVEANAAGAVNRANTNSGPRNMVTSYVGKSGGTAASHIPVCTAGYILLPTSISAVRNTYHYDIIGLPPGHALTAVSVVVTPAAGHTTNPGLLPKTVVYRVTSTGSTAIASASYSWVSTASYHSGFTLANTVATASQTISAQARYVLAFGNEGGADSTGSVRIRTIAASVTVDTSSGGADFTHWV